MRKFIFNGTNVLSQTGKMFYPGRGKVLFASLLVCLCCFHSYGQDKSAKATSQPSVKPFSSTQAATPLKPAPASDVVSTQALDNKADGYLILVKNSTDAAVLAEEVPVPLKAKLVPVSGNSKVTVLKFDDQATMKQWASAYNTDFKVIATGKKGLSSKLSSLGATVSTK